MLGSGGGVSGCGGTAAVVLAAGEARRMGTAKQLLRLGGETLLDRAVRVATEAGLAPVVVVLGARANEVRSGCVLEGAEVVVHEGWREGMGSSLRAGVERVRELGEQGGVVVLVCDMPGLTVEHLRRLCGAGAEVVASGYGGRRGVPAYFAASRVADLLAMRGDQGARGLLREAAVVAELEGGEMDVDTPEQMEEARRRLPMK